MMLEILGVPFSAHTRKAILAALEKGVAYRLVPVVPILSEGPMAPPPDWGSLSPLGKIPVLRDGAFSVPDSSVISLYLERRHPEPPLLPAAPGALAEALWIEEYVDSGLQHHVLHGLLAERAFARMAMNREPDEALIERSITVEIPPGLRYLDERIQGRTYFAGDAFSVADIAVASILINYHYAGCQLSQEQYPHLHKHFYAQLTRPSFQQAFATELPAARQIPTLDVSLLERVTR